MSKSTELAHQIFVMNKQMKALQKQLAEVVAEKDAWKERALAAEKPAPVSYA